MKKKKSAQKIYPAAGQFQRTYKIASITSEIHSKLKAVAIKVSVKAKHSPEWGNSLAYLNIKIDGKTYISKNNDQTGNEITL